MTTTPCAEMAHLAPSWPLLQNQFIPARSPTMSEEYKHSSSMDALICAFDERQIRAVEDADVGLCTMPQPAPSTPAIHGSPLGGLADHPHHPPVATPTPPAGQDQQAPSTSLSDDVMGIGDGSVQALLRKLIEMEEVYHRCKIDLLHRIEAAVRPEGSRVS